MDNPVEIRAVDDKITSAEASVASLRDKLEALRKDYTMRAGQDIAGRFEGEVKKAVEENPVVAKKLGVDGLKPLRDRLRELVANAAALTAEELSRDQHWAHTQAHVGANDTYYTFKTDNKAPKPKDGVRKVYFHVFELLREFGLTHSPLVREALARRGYPYWFELEKTTEAIEANYIQLMDQFIQSRRNLDALKKEKEKLEAANLWKSTN